MTELSDELLVAYVDGQLARKQTRAVEKVLAQDDVIARRVDALKDAHSRLESAFEAILAGEELDVSAKSVPQGEGIWIEWRLAKMALAVVGIAAAIVLALVGYGWPLTMSGLMQHPQASTGQTAAVAPSWQQDVARAHALLSRASLEVGLESQGNQDLVAFQLGEAIGSSLKLPDLSAEGFRFVRAQLLRSGGEPLAQLLYLARFGAPLAFYAKKAGGVAAPAFERHGAIGSVAWADDGVAYLLTAEADEADLMRLADKIRREPQPTAQSKERTSPPYTPWPKPQQPQ